MLKHEINGNLYQIKDSQGNIKLTIELVDDEQIILSTTKEVFSGAIDYLTLGE